MAPAADERTVVGSAVHTLAKFVTAEAECRRRYELQNQGSEWSCSLCREQTASWEHKKDMDCPMQVLVLPRRSKVGRVEETKYTTWSFGAIVHPC
jgi:hypothetical protein